MAKTKREFAIDGMMCATCVKTIETAVKKLVGVDDVVVNLATERMEVTADEGLDNDTIKNQVASVGYQAKRLATKEDERKSADFRQQALLNQKKHVIASVIAALSVFLLMMLMELLPLPMAGKELLAVVQLILTTGILISWRQIFVRGFAAAKMLAFNMETLVSLGSLIAFFTSVVGLCQMIVAHKMVGLTFDTAAIIVVLVAVGKYLEQVAKNHSQKALDELFNHTKVQVEQILPDQTRRQINADALNVGDKFIAKVGMVLPVDGTVIDGKISVNQANISGEVMPETKKITDEVLAATSVVDGTAVISVTHAQADSRQDAIIELVKKAQNSKGKIARIVDVVASYFVVVILIIAMLAGSLWAIFGNQSLAASLQIATSTLVIACPCALGLATPVALTNGFSQAAKLGIGLKDAATLEHLAHVKHVVFDKTATLTTGKVKVADTWFDDSRQKAKLLQIAASMESQTAHPLAQAFLTYANSPTACALDMTVKTYVGQGISGKLAQTTYRLGKASFVTNQPLPQALVDKIGRWQQSGASVVYLSEAAKVVAAFSLADELRADSAKLIKWLSQNHINVHLLSGDGKAAVNHVAKALDIDDVYANQTPESKMKVIEQLKQDGIVAMVGDGINDAAALAKADIGVAVLNGVDTAKQAADVLLTQNGLKPLIAAIKLSKLTQRNIAENLWWATLYNVVGVLFASGLAHVLFNAGWLNPMFAASAMALSSLSVILNANRINFQAKKLVKEWKELMVMNQTVLKVNNMKCAGCANTVQAKLNELFPGTTVSLSEKTATIPQADVDIAKINHVLADTPYSVSQ